MENESHAAGYSEDEADDFEAAWQGEGADGVEDYQEDVIHLNESRHRPSRPRGKGSLNLGLADGVKDAADDANEE